jgi:hypothetical protein
VNDNKKNPHLNPDHAGTVENFKPYVIGGATGGSGWNYTGGLSGTASGWTEPAVKLKLKLR